MKDVNGTISAFQRVLSSFKFIEPVSFSETFAQQRFLKKFQEPMDTTPLAEACFSEWLSTDRHLPDVHLPPPEWYKARRDLCNNLGVPNFSDVGLPTGSEFIPTKGQNSVEAKLSSSKWTCTRDCFDDFAKVVYSHKGLKKAFRHRYSNWYLKGDFDISCRQANRVLYNKFRTEPNYSFHIFKWKLGRVVTFVEGSRFSTVPKNNEKRRPINVEPFGNMVVQRSLGNWLRSELSRIYNIDLDDLADVHRRRICDVDDIATIDLKNASDCISMSLCRFLLPSRIMRVLDRTRSPFVLGLDGDYHMVNKISSMGNGFTFELMSLILTAVTRVMDKTATVFGDDIIIARDQSERLMTVLTQVGLQVNSEKSFTTGDFRESCGANYHRVEGYIESYDFMWPDTIGDCVLICNKARRLRGYPSFKRLYDILVRVLPTALHGGPNYAFDSIDTLSLVGLARTTDSDVTFPNYFVTPSRGGKRLGSRLALKLGLIHHTPEYFRLVPGYEFKSDLRSPTLKHLPSRRWAKYEMYLAGGRRSKDVLTNKGHWALIWFVTSDNATFRASSL